MWPSHLVFVCMFNSYFSTKVYVSDAYAIISVITLVCAFIFSWMSFFFLKNEVLILLNNLLGHHSSSIFPSLQRLTPNIWIFKTFHFVAFACFSNIMVSVLQININDLYFSCFSINLKFPFTVLLWLPNVTVTYFRHLYNFHFSVSHFVKLLL